MELGMGLIFLTVSLVLLGEVALSVQFKKKARRPTLWPGGAIRDRGSFRGQLFIENGTEGPALRSSGTVERFNMQCGTPAGGEHRSTPPRYGQCNSPDARLVGFLARVCLKSQRVKRTRGEARVRARRSKPT